MAAKKEAYIPIVKRGTAIEKIEAMAAQESAQPAALISAMD